METVNSQISNIELINNYGIVFNGDDCRLLVPLTSDKGIADATLITNTIYPLSCDKYYIRLRRVHENIRRLAYNTIPINYALSIKFDMYTQSHANRPIRIIVPNDIKYTCFIPQHTFGKSECYEEYNKAIVLDDNNLMSFPLNFDCYPNPIEFKINDNIHDLQRSNRWNTINIYIKT